MNIGFSADNVAYVFLLFLGAIPALLVFLLLGRLVQWVLRIRSGVFMAMWVIGGLGGGALAAWYALDTYGLSVPAQVIDKAETVRIRDQGDWEYTLAVNMRYAVDGHSLPRAASAEEARYDAMRPGSGQEMVAYHPNARLYDRLTPGDEVELRILRIADLFSLTRLTPDTPFPSFSTEQLGLAAGALVLVLIAWSLRKTRVGCLLWVALLAVAAAVPLPLTYRDWQQREDWSQAQGRAPATVRNVTRITRVDPFGSSRGRSFEFDVPQQYDILQFDFTPAGAAGPVIGVDAVDMPTGSPPRFEKGAVLEIAYRLDDPREVRLAEATRTYLWLNLLAFYREVGLFVGFILALLLFFGGWSALSRRRSRPARP